MGVVPKIRGTLPTIVENQKEKNMENTMETGFIQVFVGI